MDQFQQIVLSYLKKDSLYCKINALKALCSFGSPSILMDALVELGNGQESQLHGKVVTEALLSYTGDADALIGLLWARLDRFALPIQRSVLDYIRFQSGGYCGRDAGDPEGSPPGQGAASGGNPVFWEIPLRPGPAGPAGLPERQRLHPLGVRGHQRHGAGRYDGQDVVSALLRAMNSSNWYIRSNAASSLEAHGLTYEEMLKVLGGDDRYAREMLTYRLKAKRLEQEAAEQAASAVEEQHREEELAGV